MVDISTWSHEAIVSLFFGFLCFANIFAMHFEVDWVLKGNRSILRFIEKSGLALAILTIAIFVVVCGPWINSFRDVGSAADAICGMIAGQNLHFLQLSLYLFVISISLFFLVILKHFDARTKVAELENTLDATQYMVAVMLALIVVGFLQNGLESLSVRCRAQ